ncbi:hypothetical protein TSOC_011229 [Tetrabaena socialis]|uniref:Uncharacterized protein n=1 Tax=Tetrabaena socialis TaxID=47790 RepID=A0A2J7ZR63_9CHLO|nr:hypothetical protein TSOC_011229 [Tetrabaena socialis]|eukprot:PNH02759.1 hypothetical protein TSOC_011229 [Tetrabaena socialis]
MRIEATYTGRKTGEVAQAELEAFVGDFIVGGYYQEHGANVYSDVADFAVQNSGNGPPLRRISQSIYVEADQAVLDNVAALWEALYANPIIVVDKSNPYDGQFTFWAQYRYGPGSRAGKAPHVAAGMRTAMFEMVHENIWLLQNDDFSRAPYSDIVAENFRQLGSTSYQNHCNSWSSYNSYDTDYKTRFYQGWDGLTAVKKKYDPCNLYSVKYGPGWDLPKATCDIYGPCKSGSKSCKPSRRLAQLGGSH